MAGSEEGGRAELGRLEGLGRTELREEWRRLYRSPAPSLSRDLLVRALAYRMQEMAQGGLPRATLRKLSPSGTKATEEDGAAGSRRVELDLRPGSRLVREWHGRTHTVVVTAGGFEYAGANYRSLSQIARLITGARWSGPRFFAPTKRSLGGAVD